MFNTLSGERSRIKACSHWARHEGTTKSHGHHHFASTISTFIIIDNFIFTTIAISIVIIIAVAVFIIIEIFKVITIVMAFVDSIPLSIHLCCH